MNIPPQSVFLYDGKWTPELDTILVDTLVRLKRETRWLLNEFPSYFLLSVAHEIYGTFALRFTEEELATRVETLHTRYRTFKLVLRMPGASWDFPTKSVLAPQTSWEKLCKRNHFAGAYYYHEEPEYAKVACLFGMDDVKVEGEKEVIVLSDTTEKLSSGDHSSKEASEGMEEVNSPIVQPTAKARRKLFSDNQEPCDRESTTDPAIYFIDLCPNGQLHARVEKGRVLPKNPTLIVDEVARSSKSSHGSSCGSNSPLSWWPSGKK